MLFGAKIFLRSRKMRKKFLFVVAAIVTMTILLTACGSDNSGESQSDTKKVTYQTILDDYSAKIKSKTPELVKEYKKEGKNKDISTQAEICSKKIQKLADITAEGTSKMADLMIKNGDDYDVYEKWAMKLSDKYMSYASKITDVYSNSATDALVKSLEPSVEQ